MADWRRREDDMLDEIGRLNKGWQSERDFIRTICEVNMVWADDNSRAVLTAILHIVKGAS